MGRGVPPLSWPLRGNYGPSGGGRRGDAVVFPWGRTMTPEQEDRELRSGFIGFVVGLVVMAIVVWLGSGQ